MEISGVIGSYEGRGADSIGGSDGGGGADSDGESDIGIVPVERRSRFERCRFLK